MKNDEHVAELAEKRQRTEDPLGEHHTNWESVSNARRAPQTSSARIFTDAGETRRESERNVIKCDKLFLHTVDWS